MRAREREAFIPSGSMEAQAWKVMGAWQALIEEVRFMRFQDNGHERAEEVVHPNADQMPKMLRRLARVRGVRWPSDAVSRICLETRELRNDLSHMVYIDTVSGAEPDRTMSFWRVGEMTFRDEVWSQQGRYRIEVTEQQLSDAIEGVHWIIMCCRMLSYLGDIFREFSMSDDHPLAKHIVRELPWWFEEWGDPATAVLSVGQVRGRV
ncbi:hypothetical protein CRM89_15915 [Nocardia sp. FDAARGOS_372]|nr:hypothetical protein CRM89_15915 [Nocardia sp. FDAARGOS_372]